MNDKRSKIWLESNLTIDLVYCVSGTYVMGQGQGPTEHQHEVTIGNSFWIGTTPVTRKQFSSVVTKEFARIYEYSPESPASQHNWLEAIEFCTELERKLGSLVLEGDLRLQSEHHVTLPTEEQWEYACKAGTSAKWFFGDDTNSLDKFAWYGIRSEDFEGLPSVGQKLPNPWGLYDMYGLVFEWCLNDIYKYKLTTSLPVTFPTLEQQSSIMKAVRGGSINSSALHCRSASRHMIDHWNSENDLTGFRIVINET